GGFAAALNGEPRRLVDDDDVVVLVDHQASDEVDVLAGHARRRARRGLWQRRHTDDLPRLNRIGRLRACAIDAHLPRADELFDLPLAQLRKAAAQPAIEPRFAVIGADLNRLNTLHTRPKANSAQPPPTLSRRTDSSENVENTAHPPNNRAR